MTKNEIAELRSRHRLSDLVRPIVQLKRDGRNWVGLCNFHREKTPSFKVRDDTGTFKCFGCGAWGDVIDWVMLTQNLGFVAALAVLSEKGVTISPGSVHQIAHSHDRELDETRRIAHAHAIWLKRAPIEETLAERYLTNARGLKGPFPPILGFVHGAYCSPLSQPMPALIAPLQDSHGHVTAVQQVFLEPETDDACRDVNDRRIKRTQGAMRDGCVRLAMPNGTLGLAGSVEDALSAMQLFSLPVWATCGEGRLSRVWVPDGIEHLVIFADADEAGRREAERARDRFRYTIKTVEIAEPTEGKDWQEFLESNHARLNFGDSHA